MHTAKLADSFDAGAKVEVVGVAENNFRANFFKQVLRDTFHRSQRAYRHEDRGFNRPVRGGELAAPGWAGGGLDLESAGHLGIVRDAKAKTSPRRHGDTEEDRDLRS